MTIYGYQLKELQTEVIKMNRNSRAGGYTSRIKALKSIAHDYWWPGFKRYTVEYVTGCQIFSCSKPNYTKIQGLLLPLPIN